MTILLILGGALVILAVLLVPAAVGTTASGQAVSGVDRSVALVQALSNAPTELTKEYDESFADRVMAPFQALAVAHRRRLSGGEPPSASAGGSTSPATRSGGPSSGCRPAR